VNMNIHSCPVKSTLLPLQLLEYGVMQYCVIRPNFVLTWFVLKGQVCEKSYGASFWCRKSAHPYYVMAWMVRTIVCPGIIVDDQHYYILPARRRQRRKLLRTIAVGMHCCPRQDVHKKNTYQPANCSHIFSCWLRTLDILASFEGLVLQCHIFQLQFQLKITDTHFASRDNLWQNAIGCCRISI
jgi:hypothetical protein